VLTLHTKYDSVTPVATESAYLDTVNAAGYTENLVQVYTDGVGHCTLTSQQLLVVIGAMESWLETGATPGEAFFPERLGFDNDFVPPPWLKP